MDNIIYMDNAATTEINQEVLKEMMQYLDTLYGNPSSVYGLARESKKAINLAREKVAKAIGAKPEEIYFTGCGTEADNWAIIGSAQANSQKGKHIITSTIEHHAILHTCKFLEQNGYRVTYVPVDEEGILKVDELKKAICADTILITIMFANNEVGTIQPIEEIAKIAKENNISFHTDAIQAVGHIPIDVNNLNIDMLSISGHKLYGPKGVGALYIRKGVKIKPYLHGGGQERNRRAGTENVPGIVAFGKAIEICTQEIETEGKRLSELRNKLIDGILSAVPYTNLNGSREKRLPGNVNISFEFIEGESLLLLLDMKGILASSGSACTSGSLDPSHVLLSMGLNHEKAHGSLRLTLGKNNEENDITKIIEELPSMVNRLREMSPLYEDFVKGRK